MKTFTISITFIKPCCYRAYESGFLSNWQTTVVPYQDGCTSANGADVVKLAVVGRFVRLVTLLAGSIQISVEPIALSSTALIGCIGPRYCPLIISSSDGRTFRPSREGLRQLGLTDWYQYLRPVRRGRETEGPVFRS